jgi:hypothetical protein
VLRDFLGGFLGSRARFWGRLPEEEAAVRKLLDEAAFFKFFEHLEEGATVVLLEVEGAG